MSTPDKTRWTWGWHRRRTRPPRRTEKRLQKTSFRLGRVTLSSIDQSLRPRRDRARCLRFVSSRASRTPGDVSRRVTRPPATRWSSDPVNPPLHAGGVSCLGRKRDATRLRGVAAGSQCLSRRPLLDGTRETLFSPGRTVRPSSDARGPGTAIGGITNTSQCASPPSGPRKTTEGVTPASGDVSRTETQDTDSRSRAEPVPGPSRTETRPGRPSGAHGHRNVSDSRVCPVSALEDTRGTVLHDDRPGPYTPWKRTDPETGASRNPLGRSPHTNVGPKEDLESRSHRTIVKGTVLRTKR